MTSQSISPRNGIAFGPEFADTTPQEVDKIMKQARIGQRAWALATNSKRAEVLNAIADGLNEKAEALVEIADAETALGVPRLSGEVGRMCFQFREFAKAIAAGLFLSPEVDGAVEAAVPVGHPELIRTYSPIGIVVVFGANNFPFAFSVLGGDTASALAAGCAVIAKAHPSHPQTSKMVFEIASAAIQEHGFPAGVLSLVFGVEAGVRVLKSDAVSAGAFTGSKAGGRALFDIAQSRETPIPFYGELGSVNPVVALASGLKDSVAFATSYLDSLLLGSGQFCTNPSILFIPKSSQVLDEITKQIADRISTPFLSPSTKQAHDTNRSALSTLIGSSIIEGKSPADQSVSSSPAVLITDIEHVIAHPLVLTTECFGPTGVIITYSTIATLISTLQTLEGALVGSVFASATDPNAIEICKALIEKVGRLAWNSWPTGVAVSIGQQHGGPYPSSTSSIHTSVGLHAMQRFLRPVSLQGMPREVANQLMQF